MTQSGRLTEPGRSRSDVASVHLRHLTAQAHLQVEVSFAAFDAEPARYLRAFLTAQYAAARALDAARSGPALPEEGTLLSRFADDLEADLGGKPALTVTCARRLRPEATAYLALGSRLGAEVIKRRMTAAGLICPRAFRPAPPSVAWRAFRARIDGLDPAGADFAELASDACAGFEIFSRSAELAGLFTVKEAV